MAESPLGRRELRATLAGGGFRVAVRTAKHEWVLDEPADEGGTDAGPTPVEAMLGALLSCLTLSFQFFAKRKGIPIERIEGWVAANEERFVDAIAVELQVWSPAPEAEVRALLPRAEQGCFVSRLLRPDLAYSIELAVYPSEDSAVPAAD
jgi:uncharacterized OsmC-like protein